MAKPLGKLTRRSDFLRVAAARRSAASPGLVVQAAARRDHNEAAQGIRVGFTASRKVGNAVTRNRAKRRLRAAASMVLSRAGHPATDYVLIARADTPARAFPELVADLESALRRVHGARRASHEPPGKAH